MGDALSVSRNKASHIKALSLFVSKIRERMSLSFSLDIGVRPSPLGLDLSNFLLLLDVQTYVDEAKQVRDPELDSQKDHDGYFPGDVLRSVFGLEYFGSYDISDAE